LFIYAPVEQELQASTQLKIPMRHTFALFALLFSISAPVHADAVADALRAGGVAILIRHATAPGTFDPEGFRIGDCATQRNLSAEGREEARRIGARFKSLGLVPGEVLTSQWCRCRDTANLAFGAARDWPALNSFIGAREKEAAQVAEVSARIALIRPGEKPLVLVTHQVMITAISGVFPQSGEAVIVAPVVRDGKESIRVIGNILPPPAR
jgi:phosphohistidine phosphatase SixA